MLEHSDLLASYLDGLRDLSGAGSAALFVPEPLNRSLQATLLLSGELSPVPELADLDTAQSFVATLDLDEVLGKENPRELVFLPSGDPDSSLIPLLAMPVEVSPRTPSRRDSDTEHVPTRPQVGAWLGLRYPPGQASALKRLADRHLPSVVREAEEALQWWRWIFSVGGALGRFTSQVAVLLRDSATGLPGRQQFQATLVSQLAWSCRENQPLAILLVNPDNFAAVNDRWGRNAGDRCVAEIGKHLRDLFRDSDLIARYGGVIFAAIIAGVSRERVQTIASRIASRLSRSRFLDDSVSLEFSAGLALFDPEEDLAETDPLQLLQRADQALNTAKRRGGNAVVSWSVDLDAEHTGSFDRLSGIFTGNMSTDYRHMALLWESARLMTTDSDFETLCGQLVESLYAVLGLWQGGFFLRGEEDSPRLVRGVRHDSAKTQDQRQEGLRMDAARWAIVLASVDSGQSQHETLPLSEPVDARTSPEALCCAIPLSAGDKAFGCLYLEGPEDSGPLASSNRVFLQAFGSQVALGLERARSSQLESQRREQEKRSLRSELKVLRKALRHSKLVYASAEMERLLTTARRVAPTMATVLISGATGTGKELLARTIHKLSPRRDRPLVVVDCAAIPPTLIESELFGHERGAFTGADARRKGRLAEADGGTVLLDEIGELPLRVQGRLLRFTQEKQVARVGGSRVQQVDVRILAATNRDLYQEVQAGRFREDLYFRLQQLPLEVPPLRERPDDILPLAQHYLESYRVQYQSRVERLNDDAEKALLKHDWPGNVRELQNRLMKAVLLCEGEVLEAADLELVGNEDDEMHHERAANLGLTESTPKPRGSSSVDHVTLSRTAKKKKTQSLDARAGLLVDLRAQLGQILRTQIRKPVGELPPLGRWLQEDLLRAADRATGRNKRQGASLVGIPETTYRRRLPKEGSKPEPRKQDSV